MMDSSEKPTQQAMATLDTSALIEKAVIEGDLTNLSAKERVAYYRKVCESLGLNPFTKPFDYLRLNNKLVLYARRDCTDQLRALRHISVTITSRETIGDVYVVTANASTPDKRMDESTGAVNIKGLGGEFLANAYMKAETKAKRRVTLSIVGLGWMDETEIESVQDARRIAVDIETGEVFPHTGAAAQPTEAPNSPIEALSKTPKTATPNSELESPLFPEASSAAASKPELPYMSPEEFRKAWAEAGLPTKEGPALTKLIQALTDGKVDTIGKALSLGWQNRELLEAAKKPVGLIGRKELQ